MLNLPVTGALFHHNNHDISCKTHPAHPTTQNPTRTTRAPHSTRSPPKTHPSPRNANLPIRHPTLCNHPKNPPHTHARTNTIPTIDYQSPTPSPPLSKLAPFSLAAPFLGIVITVISNAITSHPIAPRVTPAQAEDQDLILALTPQFLSIALSLAALHHISRHPLRGKPLAIAGLSLSIFLTLFLSFAIISSHAWLD